MILHTLSIRNVFTHAWRLFAKHSGLLIALTFGMLSISWVFQYALQVSKDSPGLVFTLAFASWLVQVCIGMMLLKIQLLLIDTSPISYKSVYDSFVLFGKYFATIVLVGLITVAGFIVFIIPGVVFSLRLQFAHAIVIDTGVGPIEAIRQSFALTKGYIFELLLLSLAVFCIQLLGILMFGIGLFVSIPVCMIAMLWAYRQLANQFQVTNALED